MTAKEKAVVLLSGGLDSTVALAWTAGEYELGRVVFIDYGQRAAGVEARAADALARHFEVELATVRLPFFSEICGHLSVMAGDETEHDELPEVSGAPLRDLSQVWIPNRNGVFVSIGAAFAEALDCRVLVTGFNAEEADQFPDNSAEFVRRANSLLELSTLEEVRLECPLVGLSKVDIVEMGAELSAPLEFIYSCYSGDELMCGRCMSCLHIKNAVSKLSVDRPHLAEAAAKIDERFQK